jgi:hypothetical protein
MKTSAFLVFALAAVPAPVLAQRAGVAPTMTPVKPVVLKNFEFASAKAKLTMEGQMLHVQGEGEVTAKLNTKTTAKEVELGYWIVDRTGHLEINSVAGSLIIDTPLAADKSGTDLKVGSVFGGGISAFDVKVTKDGKVVQEAANQKGAALVNPDSKSGGSHFWGAAENAPRMTIKFAYLLSNDLPAGAKGSAKVPPHWTITIMANGVEVLVQPAIAAVNQWHFPNVEGLSALKLAGNGHYTIEVNHLIDN